MRGKPYVTPLLIMLLLLVLSATRWDYKNTKNFDDGGDLLTVKWKEDNWTGDEWLEVYAHSGVSELIPNGVTQEDVDFSFALRRTLTQIWWGLFLATAIWLLYATIIKKGVKPGANNICQDTCNNNANDNSSGL